MPKDWEKDFQFNEDDWEEAKKKQEEKLVIPETEYDYGTKNNRGIGIAGIGYSKNGKSLMGSLLPWLNQKWWTSSPAKEGKFIMIEDFPLTKELIKTGQIPEVELLQVIDLGGAYDSKSKMGIFGRLTEELYKNKMIKKTTIKIPGRRVKISDSTFRELAKKDLEIAKIRFDNEIKAAVADNDAGVALMIDPFDDLERLLNMMFRITYEENIAPVRPLKDGTTKDFYAAGLDGIPQKFWYMRNSWFEDALRAKRDYQGFSYDTFKIDPKVDETPNYKVAWTKRTHYFFDLIMWFDTHNYEAKVINRFKGDQDRAKPVDFDKAVIIDYTPRRVKAIYEIFEALAPSLLGMKEKVDGSYEYDDIYE